MPLVLSGLSRVLHSPLAFWGMTAVLAAASALSALRFVDGARMASARYGPLRPLLVATGPAPAGTVLGSEHVSVKMVPAGSLPPGHLAAVAHAAGRTVVVPLLAGLPVVRSHLAPDGSSGVAALLPPGRRAVAIPLDQAAPPLRVGDHVDVVATSGDTDPAADEGPSFLVAEAVPVLDVDAESEAVTVAVAPAEATRIAFALTEGVVSLMLTQPPSNWSRERGGQRRASTASTATPTTSR